MEKLLKSQDEFAIIVPIIAKIVTLLCLPSDSIKYNQIGANKGKCG